MTGVQTCALPIYAMIEGKAWNEQNRFTLAKYFDSDLTKGSLDDNHADFPWSSRCQSTWPREVWMTIMQWTRCLDEKLKQNGRLSQTSAL